MRHVPSLVLLLFAPALGVALGLLLATATPRLHVPLLMAVALGVMTGAAVGLLGYRLAVAGLVPWALACCLGWGGALGGYHLGEYRSAFLGKVADETTFERAIQGLEPLDDAALVDEGDRILVRRVGTPGFAGFLKYRVVAGLSVKGPMAAVWPTLPSPAAVAVWLLDAVVALAVIVRVGLGARRRLRTRSPAVTSA